MIFCIGFMKTATSALGWMLQRLDLKIVDGARYFFKAGMVGNLPGKVVIPDELLGADAYIDFPIFMVYKRLDKEYPDSKFILTVRSPGPWYNSLMAHQRRFRGENSFFVKTQETTRRFVFPKTRSWNSSKTLFIDRYRKHNTGAIEYFKDRPDDLLILPIAEIGHKRLDYVLWFELMRFLEIPYRAMPPIIRKNPRQD